MSNHDAYKTDFMSPIQQSGILLYNSGIDQTAVCIATNNRSHLYPLPMNGYQTYLTKARQFDIAWKYRDTTRYFEQQLSRDERARVRTMIAINGQGDASEGVEAFMRTIEVMGFVYNDNENNDSELFNVYCAGLFTIINTGNETICAGDWVIACAPELKEVQDCGRGNPPDENGVITLVTKPYNPNIHANTPNSIYNCLTTMNGSGKTQDSSASSYVYKSSDGSVYQSTYTEQCEILNDTKMNDGMIFALFLKQNGLLAQLAAMEDVNDVAAFFIDLFSSLGHGSFWRGENAVDRPLRQDLLNSFFAKEAMSVGGRDAFKKAVYFDTESTDSNQKRLVDCYNRTTGLALKVQAEYVYETTNRILGRAITSMEPKQNGDLLMGRFV